MSDPLRRRAAFWRNLEYDLDKMTEGIAARMADKWCDGEDLREMEEVNKFLFDGLKKVRARQIEVLKEQIECEE